MRSPLARFCQTASELAGGEPGPAGLLVDGGGKNVLIFFGFAFRPGFDDSYGVHNRCAHRSIFALEYRNGTRGDGTKDLPSESYSSDCWR